MERNCTIVAKTKEITCKNYKDNPVACLSCIHNEFVVTRAERELNDNYVPMSN